MHVTVLISCPDRKTADSISKLLLSDRLAACTSAIPGVRSRYWWKGRLESADEVLLLAKTTAERFPAVEKAVKKAHPYELPEIIALPIARGSRDYLEWIRKETR